VEVFEVSPPEQVAELRDLFVRERIYMGLRATDHLLLIRLADARASDPWLTPLRSIAEVA
jgi:hypothetical protein